MAGTHILKRLTASVALGAAAAAIVVCAASLPALAQQSEDIAQLNARLFEAVRRNDMGAVRSLLTQGADPMARDRTGQTPAGAAVDHGYFEIAHYILSVRNQQQAMRRREAEELDRPGALPSVAPPVGPVAPRASESVREPPTPSWRANQSKDRPTEIPSARLTPPREAVVIAPADPRRALDAARRAATAKAAPQQPKAAPKAAATRLTPPPAPQLSNLPRLPSGEPNPFDPNVPAQPALPVITATGTVAAPAATPALPAPQAAPVPDTTAGTPEQRATNPLGRLWNGLTDWFSERDAPEPATPREESSAVAPKSLGDVVRALFAAAPAEPDRTETEATRVEVAALTVVTPAPEPAAPAPVTPTPSSGPLAIDGFKLSRTLDAATRDRNCFRKGRMPGWYCLETAAWPAEIAARMDVSSWVFGRRMVVHYDNLGAAQSLYAIFPTEHFNHIVRYLEATLGTASSDGGRTVAMVGEPSRLNLVTRWTRRAEGEPRGTVLEVHKFDTTRGMIPDTRHGALSLAREGATPMFRYVAEADLMMQAMRIQRDSLDADLNL